MSLREYLTLLEGLEADLVPYDVEGFYFLARSALIKDERYIDRFDQIFSTVFKGVEAVSGEAGRRRCRTAGRMAAPAGREAPDGRGKALVESLGGFDKPMETLRHTAAH